MLIVWLCQALFGAAALALSAMTCRAVLRRDPRAHFFLSLAGSVALVFFVTVPHIPMQLPGVALLAIIAGILMAPAPQAPVSFDSTLTGKWRR